MDALVEYDIARYLWEDSRRSQNQTKITETDLTLEAAKTRLKDLFTITIPGVNDSQPELLKNRTLDKYDMLKRVFAMAKQASDAAESAKTIAGAIVCGGGNGQNECTEEENAKKDNATVWNARATNATRAIQANLSGTPAEQEAALQAYRSAKSNLDDANNAMKAAVASSDATVNQTAAATKHFHDAQAALTSKTIALVKMVAKKAYATAKTAVANATNAYRANETAKQDAYAACVSTSSSTQTANVAACASTQNQTKVEANANLTVANQSLNTAEAHVIMMTKLLEAMGEPVPSSFIHVEQDGVEEGDVTSDVALNEIRGGQADFAREGIQYYLNPLISSEYEIRN
jgi:hypothetical protein